MAARVYDHVPRLLNLDGHQPLPHPLGPSRTTVHKYRYIGTEDQPQFGQLVDGKPKRPEPVQCQQGGRRIGAPAPQSTAHRNTLSHADVDPAGSARVLLQQTRRAHD